MSDNLPPVRKVDASSDPDSISVELSMRRTGMSFQRTRMSADRTLMSVIRTGLSLITFGFSIYQFFQKLNEAGVTKSSGAPRHFGEALVLLGVGMMFLGILFHVAFMLGLRRERAGMKSAGLVHAESAYPPSLTLMVAIALLGLGIAAILSMAGMGPF